MGDLERGQCWLEFRVRWAGYGEGDDSWLSRAELHCPELLAAFVAAARVAGRLPEPGQVGVVAGGPPCQARRLLPEAVLAVAPLLWLASSPLGQR
jgi:hypothetical protein